MALRLSLAVVLCLAAQIMLLLPHQTGAWFFARKSNTPTYHFNEPLAKRLAYYTQTTYENTDQTLLAWSCDTCRKQLAAYRPKAVVSNARTGGRAIAGYDSNLHAIVVGFRGNANAENWMLSAKVGRVPPSLITSSASAGTVHKGFLEIYTSLRRSLLHNIAQLVAAHPNAPFRIAGHSMGGTQAILLSLDLKLRHPKKDLTMYNFGSPRLGNSAFRTFFNKLVPKAMRVVHTFDPVRKLPLRAMGYRHVGIEHRDYSAWADHCYYVHVKISTGCDFLTGGRRRRSLGNEEVKALMASLRNADKYTVTVTSSDSLGGHRHRRSVGGEDVEALMASLHNAEKYTVTVTTSDIETM